MNFLITAPQWAAWLLAALLVAAAVEDAMRMRISNLTSLGVLLLALAVAIIEGPAFYMWQNVAIFAGLLLVGTLLFATGKFGGGDAKLLATVGLWVDLQGSLMLLSSIFISGGVLALIILGARMMVKDTDDPRAVVLRRGAGIPYGIAIAAGALIVLLRERSSSLLP